MSALDDPRETPGLFGLTIDNDVWRVCGVYWCWFIAQMAVGMAMSILMFPIDVHDDGRDACATHRPRR